MMNWRSCLRFITYGIVFITVWFLWPRELDGYLGRLGEAIVPDYRMENSRYVSVKNGLREVEMYSKKSSFDFLIREMHAEAVTIYFYDQEEKKTVVTANKGEFFMDGKRFHLIEDVHSESPDGFILTGPEANYFVNEKRLEAPQPVQGNMKDNSLKLWGNRAEGDMDQKKLWLYGDARANYIEKQHGLTKIRGDKAEIDRTQDEVQFFKNVKVEQEKTVGTGERGTLYYAANNRTLRYMSLQDDVKIAEEGGKHTRSQVAEFFTPTDTIVLTGFPAVYNGDDAVTGDKITMYRATGVVEVLSTNAAMSQDGTRKKSKTTVKHSDEDDELIP